MKILTIFAALLSVIASSCLHSKYDDIPIALQDSVSVFKNIQLQKDSLNISIRMGEKTKIPLINDTLEIEVLKINKFCYLGEISCDLSTKISIRLRKNRITNTLPTFDLGIGAGSIKTIYPLPNCNHESQISNDYFVFEPSYTFNNLIFAIKEITPYPISREEVISMTEKRLFYINLIILNKCKK